MSLSAATQEVAAEPPATKPRLALDAIYREHFAFVWRNLKRWGVREHELDDAAQNVFIVVHRRLESFHGGSIKAWLFAILVRVAGDHRRATQRSAHDPLPDELDDPRTRTPGQVVEHQRSVQLLHELLLQLDERKRTAFVLSELEQMSVPEIAEALDENVNTVYSRLRVARREFERNLERHRKLHGTPRGGAR